MGYRVPVQKLFIETIYHSPESCGQRSASTQNHMRCGQSTAVTCRI